MTDTDTPTPLSAERHAEIQTAISRAAVDRDDLNPIRTVDAWILAAWDLDDEVKRLTTELAKYTGWEPTVREEYEHACQQTEQLAEIVRGFKRDHGEYVNDPGRDDTVTEFVIALEKALEIY